jgi:two-component system CheB/CheR fusion protein
MDPQPQLRVLVLDDVPDATDSLALLVRFWGHQPFVAYDGPTALDLARTHAPDVVFLDIALRDDMDGYEVARRLRQLPGMDKALLVAVTGYGRKEDVWRCWDAGIDFHFVKPVDPVELERVLAGVARFARENRQLARGTSCEPRGWPGGWSIAATTAKCSCRVNGGVEK